MNERSIYLIAALAGKAVVPIQVAAICAVLRYPLPAATALVQTSWWMWLGGCLGVLYVSSSIFATPRIKAALMLALAIAGQMVTALFLDYFGAIGLVKYPASPVRIAGVVLVVLDVSLVTYATRR